MSFFYYLAFVAILTLKNYKDCKMSNHIKKPLSVSIYDGVKAAAGSISFIYNEVVGANALKRNGAEAEPRFFAGMPEDKETCNIASRHTGTWLAFSIAALGAPNPTALGVAAAVYTTMTVVPATYRIGKFKKAAYEDAVAQAEKDGSSTTVSQSTRKAGAFGMAARIRR